MHLKGGLVVQLVRTLACHARGRGFEPHSGRHFFMREWLSGRASPCQGECREFESRLPLHFFRRHSQVVRQRPAKPSPPVQIWVAPPKDGLVVQLVRTLACHARGRGFEPHSGRHLSCGSGSVVERRLAKANVASSNLVFRSIKTACTRLFFVSQKVSDALKYKEG